jgi:vesicular inhibitory amino acid transporter
MHIGSSQNVAMFVITVHVLLVIPFYLYVFTTRIETWLNISYHQHFTNNKEETPGEQYKRRKSKLMRIALRLGQIISCGIIAMLIPYFSDFMTLVGTILSDTLTFVLPSLFWMQLNRGNGKGGKFEFVLCVLVATIGICCATVGTMDAVKALIHDYNNQRIVVSS